MAVAEMQKLNLVAMSYDRDGVLDALQRTGAVEIKEHRDLPDTLAFGESGDELQKYLAKTEGALEILTAEIGVYNSENKIKSDELKDGFAVAYSDFISAWKLKDEMDGLAEKIYSLSNERRTLSNKSLKTERAISAAQIYSLLELPFSAFGDTSNAKVRLGVLPATALDELSSAVARNELFDFKVISNDGENALVIFVFHRSQDGDAVLSQLGFSACPYKDGTGAQLYAQLNEELREDRARAVDIGEELRSLGNSVKTLKLYCDWVRFSLEKQVQSQKMRRTDKTFLLEAYVPKDAKESVCAALEETTDAVYYEFSEPDGDEMPPTLYKNNEVVKNFETITDTYSPVNAKEFDPNGVMAFFYSLFLGFIMGDVGYGLIMLLGGGFVYWKKRGDDGGLKRLSGVFAVGGIFAILWGVLFNSVFGIGVFPFTVMPNAKDDTWGVMGIQVPAVLLISLEIGVAHLLVGYVCKAIQCMRRGQFWDGILDGLVWVVFSLGVGLAIAGFIDELAAPYLAYIGGVMAGVALVIAIFTAGRKENLLGKFTKGFGTAYGVINYASDILSYARLYGLMLSGAVIAQIISGYAVTGMDGGVGFLASGNPALIILGVVLLVVGHAFNLAIGLLGAYIHDARLQYVEFYGRFYEGEGELFAPLGSNHKFIKLENSAVKTGGSTKHF
ncbi:MAG: V-type ATP synthase subunit I [Clostridia bacterium]|nr:V-type ATP synthase subunit I [Clostridia bacterium]